MESKRGKSNLRKLREQRMLSRAELARQAGVSPLTIDRVEKGKSCRMDTKRKILQALGLKPTDARLVWPGMGMDEVEEVKEASEAKETKEAKPPSGSKSPSRAESKESESSQETKEVTSEGGG